MYKKLLKKKERKPTPRPTPKPDVTMKNPDRIKTIPETEFKKIKKTDGML